MNPSAAVSVVVPVLNGAATLDALVAAVDTALRPVAAYEIVLVDDGSTDDSWARISALSAARTEVRGLRLRRNYGQHNALLAGIRAARNPVTVTLDADLQYPPEALPELLARLDDRCDVVYGTAGSRTEGFARRAAASVVRRLLARTMGVDATFSSLRAFRTELREGFADFHGPFVSVDVLLTWSTTRFASVPVTQRERRDGTSSYSLSRLVGLALTMLTGFSTKPLRLASLVGFAFTLLGLGLLVYVLTRFLVEGRVVPGFAFLASIIAIFAGAQLFALGIIGEYLARVHMRVLDRPSYTIGEETGAP
ncbi:MAG: hypothetical protein QOE36_611 [Gaiellaceae bacterium]|nr:hypothetical protein [Gaiellaceae bacterium]